mgnify:CR=1 FL=1
MSEKVVEIVHKYVEEHLDKSNPKQEFEVFVVWQCYILGNAKWLLSTTIPDGMYYEICLLYTYEAADDKQWEEIGGRRTIKKKKTLRKL